MKWWGEPDSLVVKSAALLLLLLLFSPSALHCQSDSYSMEDSLIVSLWWSSWSCGRSTEPRCIVIENKKNNGRGIPRPVPFVVVVLNEEDDEDEDDGNLRTHLLS